MQSRALAAGRGDLWALPLITAVLGGVYVATLLSGPGHSGDTALFQFAGRRLCIPHPTGYPLYLLLNHAFTRLLPLGSLAWRANLLSSAFAVGACLFLYRAALRLGAGRPAAVSASLAFGLTPTFWLHAVVAEVYTLNALFLSAVIFFALRWRQERRERDFHLFCGLYAASFGNHLTMITLLPGLALLVLATEPSAFRQPRRVLAVAGLILLGVLPYSYLLWRALDPATPYVDTETKTLPALWSYVTGGPFRASMLAFPLSKLLAVRLPMFLSHWAAEYQIWLLPTLAGAWALRRRVEGALLGLAFLGSLGFSLGYDIRDIPVYFIPNYLVSALLLARGLQGLVERLPPLPAVVLLACVPVSLGAFHLRGVLEARQPGPARQMEELLDRVGKDALLIGGYHEYEYLLYLLIGEGRGGPNLYAAQAPHLTPEEIAGYLREARPIPLPQLRTSVPPGLAVYSTKTRHQERLERAGLRLEWQAPWFYRLLPAGEAKPPP